MSKIESRLHELDIQLPEMPKPIANYIPVNYVYHYPLFIKSE